MPTVPRDPLRVFDRRAVRLHRARAARAPAAADFLVNESAERLADRLDDVTRHFPLALDLGCRDGALARVLAGRGGIETLVHADSVFAYVQRVPAATPRLVAEAEALPFRRHAFDLVLSNLDLHWTNDLPGALPVVDSDTVEVTYADALALMRDLRAMGETNAAVERRRSFTRRATLARAAALYGDRFGRSDGRIPASFEIITLTAWAPHESQPKPLRPGSAKARLADALGAVERPAG